MTIYCKIENGVVVNRAFFEGLIPDDWGQTGQWIESDIGQIGWGYSNGVFTQPPQMPNIEPPLGFGAPNVS